jgi:hypothetical protein
MALGEVKIAHNLKDMLDPKAKKCLEKGLSSIVYSLDVVFSESSRGCESEGDKQLIQVESFTEEPETLEPEPETLESE